MMEVKHNTPMEFKDLITPSNNLNNSIGSPLTQTDINQLEDASMDKVELLPNLKSTLVEQEDIQKTNELITNGAIISSSINGSTDVTSPLPPAIDLEDVELDIAATITPELEDELLADDEADVVDKLLDDDEANVVDKLLADDEADVVDKILADDEADVVDKLLSNDEADVVDKILPDDEADVVDKLLADDEADVVDKLLADVSPASNITVTADLVEADHAELEKTIEKPATNNVVSLRDPGDDLDTLLSKINDIVEDCSVPTADLKVDAAVDEQAVAIDEKAINDEAETNVTMNDSALVLEDSVYEEHADGDVNIKDAEAVVGTSEISNAESASQHIMEPLAQVKMPEKTESQKKDDVVIPMEQEEMPETGESLKVDDAVKPIDEMPGAKKVEMPEENKSLIEDDNVLPMEQEEVISGSDQMILDVDLDGINNEQSAKSAEAVTALEPIQEPAQSPSSEAESEKIKDQNEKDTIPNDDGSLPATEDIKDDIEIASDKVYMEAVAATKTETETLPIAKDVLQSEAVVQIATDEPTEKIDTMPTETIADAVAKVDEVSDNVHKEVEKPTTTVPSEAINLDAEDSDDDIVFFYEKSKGSDDANQQSKSVDKDLVQKKSETKPDIQQQEKIKENDDDVVLLDDDDDDSVTEVAPKAKSSKQEPEQSKLETETGGVESKTATEKPLSTNVETEVKEATEIKIIENQEVEAAKPDCDKLLLDDISDNARDKFGDAEIVDKQPEEKVQPQAQKSGDVEESNSNCSSSSNLLQESKAVASSEGGEEETDLGNDDDDDAADNDCEAMTEVEIIEADVVDDESKEDDAQAEEDKDTPPAKRMRLSTDVEDEESSSKILDKTDIKDSNQNVTSKSDAAAVSAKVEDVDIKAIKTEGEITSNKRAHDDSLAEDDIDDKNKSDIKKLKTEESLLIDEKQKIKIQDDEVEESKTDIIEIKDTKEDEDNIITSQIQKEVEVGEELIVVPTVKALPSHIPVPLYPPPVFEEPVPNFSYDFLKRFKKSLDKLTKTDLEELVMQKIAEAIIHKSEFGEMRELIEKQEKTIAAHRTKITELSKQFRDLEMVHNRVLKDIETKNSQFLMPVKITRAVGLQVFIPLKKNSDPASNAAANSVSVSSPQQTSQQSSQYRSTGNSNGPPPLTSPLRQSNNIDSSSSTVSSSSTSALHKSNIALASASAAAAAAARRGCMQKVTPQRPLETASITTSQASASAAAAPYRGVQSHATASQQITTKLLNKSASASAIAQMRNRYSGGVTSTVMQQQQQQTGRQQPSPTNNVRKVVQPLTKQPSSSSIGQQYRRSDPTAQTSSNTPASASDNYMSSVHQVPTGVSAVSITPAKPKDKSVIDLTDEDDAPTAVTPTPAAIRQRPTNTTANSGTGGSPGYILNKSNTSHVRLSPASVSNQSKPAARQQTSTVYGPKSNGNSPIPTNISTPPGTSITRIQVNTNLQRVKYGHPAPLPPTPAQNLHPAWKLPPPRPTIRISNLDNGIVISWTVEEAMDRHADCVSYQIYAYQETSGPPLIDSWRHVGDVKAMLLPMAVTLTQFQEGQRYFFAVRAVDVHHRVGPFSVPKTWS